MKTCLPAEAERLVRLLWNSDLTEFAVGDGSARMVFSFEGYAGGTGQFITVTLYGIRHMRVIADEEGPFYFVGDVKISCEPDPKHDGKTLYRFKTNGSFEMDALCTACHITPVGDQWETGPIIVESE